MNLARAFATVSGMTMLSRVLGLVREMMIAALLGAGPVAEAFFVAFRFPNLFRRFFGEGAFNMAFVPLFAKRLEGEGLDSARQFGEQAMAWLGTALLVLVLAAQLGMPWFIFVIAAGFADEPEKLSLAILFAQIQFPYLLFMSLTALFSGVLNSMGRFAVAAGAPILLNILMIGFMGAAWALEAPIGYWLSWSVFAAGVAQLVLVVWAARRAGMTLRVRRPRTSPAMGRLFRLGVPGAIAGGVTQINIVIGTMVATFFDGAVVWLALADRLYQLPLGVVGVAIGVALLPALSRQLRAGDASGAGGTLSRAIDFSMILSLPAAAALIAIPGPLVALLFGRGAFTPADVAATAQAVGVFALGLPAYVLIKALSPAYFAVEDTRTPLRFAVYSMALNTAISVALAPVIGWIAVPIGTAAAAWLNVALLSRGARAYALDAGIARRIATAAFASAIMGAVLFLTAQKLAPYIDDPWLRIPAVLGLVVAGLAIYAALAFALGVVRREELRQVFARDRGPAAPEDPRAFD